jgi:cytochrome b561
MNSNLDKYSFPMRTMHNLSAALFVLTLIIGFLLSQKIIPGKYFYIHKSFGVLVFFLVILRLFTKFNTKNIPEICASNKFEKFFAQFVHFGLYACLFLIPLSGYFMSSFYAGKSGSINFFNIFQIPFFTEKNEKLVSFFGDSHQVIVYISITLVGLHILGSLKHFIVNKVNIFKKML